MLNQTYLTLDNNSCYLFLVYCTAFRSLWRLDTGQAACPTMSNCISCFSIIVQGEIVNIARCTAARASATVGWLSLEKSDSVP
jgi:hypothetical protein